VAAAPFREIPEGENRDGVNLDARLPQLLESVRDGVPKVKQSLDELGRTPAVT
jgi:hypothetical protein